MALSGSASAAAQAVDAAPIIQRFYAATGSRELWAKKTTLEEVLERSGAGGQTTVIRRVRDERDGRFYEKTTSGSTTSERGFDGKRSWEKSARFRGLRETPGARAQGPVTSGGAQRLRDYLDRRATFVREADQTIDGKRLIVLSVVDTFARTPLPVLFYLDPASYLVARTVYQLGGVPAVQTFTDYRDVGGGRMRHFRNTSAQGDNEGWIQYSTIRYDVPVDSAVFQFPDTGKASPSLSASNSIPASSLSDSVRSATFDLVWKTIHESFWDTTFNGRDWKAIRAAYQPLALATREARAYFDVLDRMISELGQSHFRVVPPAAQRPTGSAWFRMRWSPEGLIVADVDSAEQTAGLRPGQIVLSINGQSSDQLVAAYRAKGDGFVGSEQAVREISASAALSGSAGDSVTVIVGEAGRTRALKLRLDSRGSSGPPFPVIETRQLEPDIGYVRIPRFLNAARQIASKLSQLGMKRGLVLDLRDNPGGASIDLRNVGNLFFRSPTLLATTILRYGIERLEVAGSADGYLGPMVVLVNEWSGSSSEILASALQESGRAIIVGDTTAGAVLLSNTLKLPAGAYMYYALGDVRSSRGKRLEGVGVVPDIVVPYRAVDFAVGRDAALATAIEMLRRR